MKDKIIKTKELKHPIQDVWKAISVGEFISKWFIQADFKAEVGYNYTFTHESSVIKGEVLKANPVTELVYTWVVGGTDAITTVSWTLEDKENTTVVTVEHTGISNYTGDTAAVMFEKFEGGWENCLNNLHKFFVEA